LPVQVESDNLRRMNSEFRRSCLRYSHRIARGGRARRTKQGLSGEHNGRSWMRRSIKKVVNALLEPTGYTLARAPRPAASPAGPTSAPNRNLVALESALTRITGRGLEIDTIIDVGASNGQWTNLAHPYFPKAAALLVEANPVHEASLRQFTQNNTYAKYVMEAAGDTTGEIYFDASDPFSGLASHTPLAVPTISVPVTTIDTLVEERRLQPPFLIKLDTHGFEVPILRGAEQALKDTNLLIVETYVFQINPTSLKFYEICQLLSTWGFATIDFCEPMWRVRDNSFWQFDLIFIRDDRKEFESNSYA
jgi:FkbM family methyltransferase